MKILKSGSCDLSSFSVKEIDISDVVSMKKLEVYIKTKSFYNNIEVIVSDITMGKFTISSNKSCTVNWIIVETSEMDILSYMKLYPIF